jgi:hypothetical protein
MSSPQADRVELLQGTLERETGRWMRLAGLVNKLLTNES